jgi:hypothetical protein
VIASAIVGEDGGNGEAAQHACRHLGLIDLSALDRALEPPSRSTARRSALNS